MHISHRFFLYAARYLLLVLLLFTGSCGEENQKSGEQTELLIGGAASLKDLFEEVAEKFEKEYPDIDVSFNFAGSNIIARQVESHAPLDLVALAAGSIMDRLDSEGYLLSDSRTTFAHNQLCVVFPVNDTTQSSSLSQLITPAIKRIVIASPGVPARLYAEEALRNANLWDQLLPRFVYGSNVRQVLSYVERQEVDCGFVYESDARISPRVRIAFRVDPTLHAPIEYPIALLRESGHQKEGEQFIAFLLRPETRAILEKYGFR